MNRETSNELATNSELRSQSGWTVDTAFAGGNGLLRMVQGDTLFLQQDLRDTRTDWFYWAVRVRGECGVLPSLLTLEFEAGDVCTRRGAAVSADGRRTWHWLGEEAATLTEQGVRLRVPVPAGATELYVAHCPLYTEQELEEFLTALLAGKVQRHTMAQSRAGREVPLLLAGPASAPVRVLLSARHHACETLASWVLEGILASATGNDELGEWFARNVQLACVPFVDRDGVEAGDQGKNRAPFDHNRDYGGTLEECIYPETRALRQWGANWLAGAAHSCAFDLHCPWLKRGLNEKVYLVGSRDQENWRRATEFSRCWASVARGPIPFDVADNLAWGQDWNTLSGEGIGNAACSGWFAGQPGVEFATSLETPYSNANGAEVTPESARLLGRDLAQGLKAYWTRQEL